MEPYEYETMYNLEGTYWWYRGLHAILLDALQSLGIGETSKVLDAGCGTGQNAALIRDSITQHIYGIDYSQHGVRFCKERGLFNICVASVNELPFPSDTFDAAMSIDVLECDEVIEDDALRELIRVVRPGGHLVLVVPAYDWLLSEQHHKAVRASRRYSRSRFGSILKKHGVTIVRMTHLFASLLPAVAAYRFALNYVGPSTEKSPRSELKPLPSFINEFLFHVVNAERKLLRRIDLPCGSSILAICRKA